MKRVINQELHLRQLTIEEAIFKLDHFLNDAFLASLSQVRIVHGKGTGSLRQAIHEELSKHPLVKSFRLGDFGEGGAGVTIVDLASRT